MNNVNGVTTNNDVTTLNPAEMSQQDFIAAVYLERGEMLDAEVRRIIGEIDTSNQYVDAVNTLIGKANVAEYGSTTYTQPTWDVSGSNVVLDNGYGLNIRPDGNGGNSFVLLDGEGNQLVYQNQTLIPIPRGATVDALEVGIPVMSDMTMVLDDGTKITFQTAEPETAFNQQTFSGGQVDISRIVITRGNQGMQITGLNGSNTPVISEAVVAIDETAGGTASGTGNQGGPVTEVISVPAGQFESYKAFDSNNYDVVDDNFANYMVDQWTTILSERSPAEQQAILASMASGATINWSLAETDNQNNTYNKSYTVTPRVSETLPEFIERLVMTHANDFRRHVSDAEGAAQIQAVWATINVPQYSFNSTVTIPTGEKTTRQYARENVSLSRNYEQYGYGSLLGEHPANMILEIKDKLQRMQLSSEQEAGLIEKLKRDGWTLDWVVKDEDGTDNTYQQSYTYKMAAGETLSNFIDRSVNETASRMLKHSGYDHDEGRIWIRSIDSSVTIPDFNYDVYTTVEVEEESAPAEVVQMVNTLDVAHNDGYILLESGGVHSWEYNGKNTGNIVQSNPNDSDDQVTGYFARKLAFEQDLNNEFNGSVPFLTQKEKDLLSKELRITYADASSDGFLTPEEWSALKENLINARDNLNGNSQLQTVQLQRAMQTYNQNFEAMSNAQQKIYSLLRDIISNIK